MSVKTNLSFAFARLRRCILLRWHAARGVYFGPGVSLGKGVELDLGVGPHSRRGRVTIARNVKLSAGAILHAYGGSIDLREHVYLGPYVVIYGHGGVTVGDESLLSMHCRILSSEHTIAPPGIPIRSQPDVMRPTAIGRDVWLGAGVTVLGGVTIGDGCVVGAGAVVTRDLPAHSIAVGVPARVIGNRATWRPPDTTPSA